MRSATSSVKESPLPCGAATTTRLARESSVKRPRSSTSGRPGASGVTGPVDAITARSQRAVSSAEGPRGRRMARPRGAMSSTPSLRTIHPS
jgi:hypothetical protein